MKWKILVLYISLITMMCIACTRKKDQVSLLQIAIPASSSNAKITSFVNSEPLSLQSTSSITNEGPHWNALLDPTLITDVDCILIAISGPESDMRRNLCTTTTGQNLYVGRWRGGIPKTGTTLSLEVPSGPQREIVIVGFKSQNGACKDFRLGTLDESNLSEPVILGSKVMDLSPGSVNIAVDVTVNSSSLKIADCHGPDFDMQGQQGMFFGNAPSGGSNDYTVVASTSVNASSLPTNLKTAYSRVTGFTTSPLTTPDTELNVSSTTGFATSDEVMLIVMGAQGSLGPTANNDYAGCGYRAWDGRYQFAQITNISGGTISISKGTFVDDLWKDANGDNIIYDVTNDLPTANTRLSAAASSTQFCYLQMVRVPHFFDLTINTNADLNIGSTAFSWTTGGGVLAFRVEDNLTFLDGAKIKADGAGFSGIANRGGDGIRGTKIACLTSTLDNGGGCSSTDGGGGGHGDTTNPIMGGISGGNGGSAQGGSSVGEDCGDGACFGNLQYKMFPGGAGGGTTSYAGLNGGGIIFIAARNIVVPTSPTTTPTILADAASGGTSGVGGGAGGSIMLYYKNLYDGTSSLPSNLILSAVGSNGATGSYGGGAGAGGRVHVVACKTVAGISQVPPAGNYLVSGGAGGAGTVSGQSGQAGSFVSKNLDCP